MAGTYSIGSDHWPGLSKLIEEAGEVLQVVGKIIAVDGASHHWDGGPDLDLCLMDELGDLWAAIEFVISANALDPQYVFARYEKKLGLFEQWHHEQGDEQWPDSDGAR